MAVATGEHVKTESAKVDTGFRHHWVVDAMVRSYAQILLSRSPVVGALLLCATLIHPAIGIYGVGSALLANGFARWLSLDEGLIREGLYGYNAMLIGLGIGSMWQPGAATLLIALVAVITTVALTASVHALFGRIFALPALTVPFLVSFHALLGLSTGAKLPWHTQAPSGLLDGILGAGISETAHGPLAALGGLFFMPDPAVGAMVVLAWVVASRIGLSLGMLGWGVAMLIESVIGPSPQAALGYNLPLVAYALGGIWFVPSVSSYVFAAGTALVAGFLALGMAPLFARVVMPTLIVPFNLTVLMVLYAMRQRTRDAAPKSVDFASGTPEANLAYYRSRLERFGATASIALSLPFLGRWVITQGIDGEESHRGPWRHAFDFEIQDAVGRYHRDSGVTVESYYCYGLPVLATADGTVIKIIDGVPDNEPGQMNLDDNWGNLVIIQHGYGLYVKLCHLQPGSISVAEGQFVRAGDIIGKCGNSGRAARPHIHMQLQYTARVGAPTADIELHDIVHELDDGPVLYARSAPTLHTVVRNVESAEDVTRMVNFAYGEQLELSDQNGNHEILTADIDAWGRLLLRSDRGEGVLIYERTDDMLTVYDTLAPRNSMLHVLHAALSRVSLDADEELTWQDHVVIKTRRNQALQPLRDVIAPFWHHRGELVTFQKRRDGTRLTIYGESVRQDASGPVLSTEASFDTDGLLSASLVWQGKEIVVIRTKTMTDKPSNGALRAE